MVLLAALACTSKPADDAPPDFPADFAFGAATAGFQVDMGCPTWTPEACDDPASDWYAWVTDPEIVGTPSLWVSGEPVGNGPGMWELFEDDAARMAADGFDVYRMSLEWSRLFPDGAAEAATSVDALDAHADPDAVARYHEMFAALRTHDLRPIVTINHYTLPLWVHDGVACHADPDTCAASGWVDGERIVPLVGRYAGWVAREFGGEVDTWFTLNEPFATSLSGYLLPGEARSSPPGLTFDVPRTVDVMRHQIEGHAAMVDAVRAEDHEDADGDGVSEEVGIVMNFVSLVPADPANPDDLRGVEHADYLYHRLTLDAVTSGAWDDDLDGVSDRTRDDLAGRLDVLGINYYNRVLVTGLAGSLSPDLPILDLLPEFGWDPYPEGLGEAVRRAAAWDVPLWVTENGTPYVEDRGVEVLDGHLAALRDTLAEGHDVRGYLYWSLVDNYEWNHGFDLKFGLYALDPDTKERIERPVLGRYREVVATGRL